MTAYTLTRSKRRTVALYIRESGVEVRAPLKMPKRDIDKFVASKERWIGEKVLQAQAEAERRSAFRLNYGDYVPLIGKEYPIVPRDGDNAGFENGHFFVPPNLTGQSIKELIVEVYKLTAKDVFTSKVKRYAKLINVTPTAVKVNGAKTRWGSCSGKNSLNFSWRLVLADDAVIDYVVVHELAHIKERNHSPRFWAVVAGALPDYKERHKNLKELQRRLAAEDWE